MKEVQKNQQEIHHLRQRLARAQTGFNTPDELSRDMDIDDETTNISIIKLA